MLAYKAPWQQVHNMQFPPVQVIPAVLIKQILECRSSDALPGALLFKNFQISETHTIFDILAHFVDNLVRS